MNITKHIVTSANWDTGRGGKKVTGIVLHTMVGYMQGSENRFNDPSSGVSVHYGVGMDGSIRQWVEEANTAWQAGNYPVNQTTIGIEHEDNGNANDSIRTDAEYEASSDLVADICRRYGFPADTNHIFLHKNVIDKSRYPGGTACPDGLDTSKIISMASAKLGGSMNSDQLAEQRETAIQNVQAAVYLPTHETNTTDDIIARVQLVNGDVDNLLKDVGITPTQADYDALKQGPKNFVYYLQTRLKAQMGTLNKASVEAYISKNLK